MSSFVIYCRIIYLFILSLLLYKKMCIMYIIFYTSTSLSLSHKNTLDIILEQIEFFDDDA